MPLKDWLSVARGFGGLIRELHRLAVAAERIADVMEGKKRPADDQEPFIHAEATTDEEYREFEEQRGRF
jgi:hypothetical protein